MYMYMYTCMHVYELSIRTLPDILTAYGKELACKSRQEHVQKVLLGPAGNPLYIL